jgi:predicted signal transduction protein with EAL and GGDEF domain
VARLGGDEFVILLEELSDDPTQAAAKAEAVAEKVLAAFAHAFAIVPGGHACSTSLGITLFGPNPTQIDLLMRRADLAMYHAKAAGPGHVRFFDPDMQLKINARAQLENELRCALHDNQFLLHYQPQFDRNGSLTGAEALVRWRHPARGLVYPGNFIALAEETGLILQIGDWILRTVCEQLRQWQTASRLPAPVVSVNVSVREFRHPDFVPRALAIIDAAGIDPSRLKFELTEGMLIENFDEVVTKMAQLKSHGIGFSLDDFGTGYSSLSYLKRLPIDQLKIDQSFVRDVLDDYHDAAIAKTIVALGQTLGLDVIAEGVETEGQRDFLADSGCLLYQGFLFSRPVPAEQL